MSGQSSHRPRSDLYYRKLVDGGIIYDEVSGAVHHLNATAAWIWEAFLEGRSPTDIIGELARAFDLDPGSVETDVEQAQDEFAGSGLFEPQGE